MVEQLTLKYQTMKKTYCILRNCPRLTTYRKRVGDRIFEVAECNQHMPDEAVYWEEVGNVERERCKELRAAMKNMRKEASND